MSLQKTVSDIGSGVRDTVRGALERDGKKELRASDELITGAGELLGNVVHFLPATVEFGTAAGAIIASGGLTAGIAPIILGSLTLKDELDRNQVERKKEIGRIGNTLPPGTFAQNKNSMTDPSHILHRSVQTIADKTIKSNHVRLDSAIKPPDENINKPIITNNPKLFNMNPTIKTTNGFTAKPETLPSNAVPSNTGGVSSQTVKTNPF